jgi:hypothetical protein
MVNGDAGVVVTPAGNPENATVTGSEKPPCAVVDNEKVESEPPALAVSADGDDAMLKSDRGFTVKASCATWVSAAEVPLSVSVKVAGETFAGTDSVTVWLLPAATLKGEEGDVVAPAGNPESVTITESLNPF